MLTDRFAEYLGVFADVAREGSFSGAARRRGITPSSVARQIDALEGHLDAALFLRSTRMLTLTESGQALLVRARRVLDELDDAQQEIASMKGEVQGVLRIACFPTFGRRHVIPVVATLAQHYPALRIELDLTERLADPVAERLDAVIRIGSLADSTLIATRIARQTRLLCASPAYLALRGVPAGADALRAHCLVDKLHGNDLLGWADLLGAPVGGGQAVFRCDDFEAMFQAIRAGMGIGLLPDWVVGQALQDGELVQVLPQACALPCMHTDIHVLRALAQPAVKLRTFIDALKAHIGVPERWAVAAAGAERAGP
ncbi:LysR family transcriptional regulator [Massilia sp. CFBP9012]|uniref:LysR family transcriptional regulator n=1 Tax=Massilia sp. CFBP9012 TaxID=3096531 RepID=UPI002A6B06B7|nr:LysR family transcriptional regulator [Massilia sp. CFBP9012]MDY0973869.1 LysR family transcriptional regulator [Massilia sp. CFBP9012]